MEATRPGPARPGNQEDAAGRRDEARKRQRGQAADVVRRSAQIPSRFLAVRALAARFLAACIRRSRFAGIAASIGFLALFAYCSEPEVPPSPYSLELGTVDVKQPAGGAWVDFHDGDAVELAPGAQGGFHIWLLYRTTHLLGSYRIKRVADRLKPEGGRDRVLTTEGVQKIEPAAGDPEQRWQLPDPLPSFMCPVPINVNVLDAPIELTVRIEENRVGGGPLLIEKKVTLRPHCPPAGDGQHEFCESICK
jgi:hypothetical protein